MKNKITGYELFGTEQPEMESLLKFGMREDCHEPDESGVTATVVGKQFDNAFGNIVKKGDPYQEKVVIFKQKDGSFKREVKINLATLTAMAIAGYKSWKAQK